MGSPRLAAVLAALLTVAWLWIVPYRLTDGDSCLYAAMGHEVAVEGNWAAPTWAHGGERADFHENPPLVVWLPAALERAGLDARQAPVIANALWLWLLAAAMWRLAGGWRGAGALALGALMLHYPVAKYVVRASLELPFAACAVAAVACLRSARPAAFLWGGLFFAGAVLSRGVFALLVPAVWLVDARVGVRRPLRRPAAALILGLSLAVLFDLFHRRATGHGFWAAFWAEQLGPSLAGTAEHANREPTWSYYGGRLLLYGQPWLLIAVVGGLRRWKRLRPDYLVGLAWVLIVFAGAVIAQRQASRYLFAAWPGLALMVGAAGLGWWHRLPERAQRRIAVVVLFLIPAMTAAKTLFTPRDEWWTAAVQLRERAALGWGDGPPPVVYGPFSAHDDRAKQFLRHHLGVWAFTTPAGGAPPGSLEFRWTDHGFPGVDDLVAPHFALRWRGEG
ncbi:MAG: hypothetical protein H8E31_15590 [Planctomycetes bacterium]|nr:hypothetical protein [Planctomycetota bacterium]